MCCSFCVLNRGFIAKEEDTYCAKLERIKIYLQREEVPVSEIEKHLGKTHGVSPERLSYTSARYHKRHDVIDVNRYQRFGERFCARCRLLFPSRRTIYSRNRGDVMVVSLVKY